MSSRSRIRLNVIAVLVTAVAVVGGCGWFPGSTAEGGTETVPGAASVWLTSDPAAPPIAVPVVLGSLDDPAIQLRHTFVPGLPVAVGAAALPR